MSAGVNMMSSRRRVAVSAWLFVLWGCDAMPLPPEDTGGVDAGETDAPPLVDGSVPIDGGRDGGGCACADAVDCTDDVCAGTDCDHRPNHTRCPAGEYCDASRGCVGGAACATVADCAPPDACVTATCPTATRTCVYAVLDGDGDGAPPAVCGGGDCDDGNALVRPGSDETCNGRDDDCNGMTDDDPSDCASGFVCPAGSCECPAAAPTDCAGFGFGPCVDTMTDPANCGFCGNACGAGATCSGGMCACAGARTYCDPDGCVDLTNDVENCGECGFRCGRMGVSGTCSAGACTCPGSEIACYDTTWTFTEVCVDPATDPENCGACGATCLTGARCTGGGCDIALDWLRVYDTNGFPSTGVPGARLSADASGGLYAVSYQEGYGMREYFADGTASAVLSTGRGSSILRLAADGAFMWSAGGTAAPGAVDVDALPSGGAIASVAFVANGTMAGVSLSGLAGSRGDSVALLGIDGFGAGSWSHVISGGASATSDSSIQSLEVQPDGTFLAAGFAVGDHDFGGGVRSASAGGGYVWRLSAAGAHLASFRLAGLPRWAAMTSTGRVVVLGTYATAITVAGTALPTPTGTATYIAQFDPDGTPRGAVTMPGTSTPHGFALVADDVLVPGGAIGATSFALRRVGLDGTMRWSVPLVGMPVSTGRVLVDGSRAIFMLHTFNGASIGGTVLADFGPADVLGSVSVADGTLRSVVGWLAFAYGDMEPGLVSTAAGTVIVAQNNDNNVYLTEPPHMVGSQTEGAYFARFSVP